MPSVYSPRWSEPIDPVIRHCDVGGCGCAGEYKAPKSRYSNDAKDYYWFCIQHVKQYNESWNYFAGMSEAEVQDFWHGAPTGHRPTWKRGRKQSIRPEDLSEAVYRSFADYLAGESPNHADPKRLLTIDKVTQQFLAVLDLEWPITVDEVKTRYKTLVKQYHPDVNPSATAEAYFKKITEAYQHLKKMIQQEKDKG
jgi:hypothetical protein